MGFFTGGTLSVGKTSRHAGLDVAAALIPWVVRERAIFPVYQPIVDLSTRRVVGVEALIRGPAGTPVESPEALLAAARRAGLMPVLDKLCFTRALQVALEAPVLPPLVFVNAEPAASHWPPPPDLLAVARSPRFRVVVELTERALTAYPAGVMSVATMANEDGNAIALDDVGSNPLSLAFLPLFEPQAVKLDMCLVRNPYAPGTLEAAAIISDYAERTGAVVIAEGVETEDDMATARALGARWGQGWLFGRPGPLAPAVHWRIDRSAQISRPKPDLYLPSGALFDFVATRHRSQPGDQPTVDALVDYVLSVARRAGSSVVVLGSYPDRGTGRAWLSRLGSLGDTAAFVGVSGPALGGNAPRRVRVVTAPVAGLADTETVLAVVGPHTTVALCIRPGVGDGMDFALTHDPSLVRAVARTLLWRLDASTRWLSSNRRHD